MALMKDTHGNEHEIVPAGVAALQSLGWELVPAHEPEAPKGAGNRKTRAKGKTSEEG